MENFKHIGDLNIAKACGEIAQRPYLWEMITERQTFPGSPHKHTQSIFLRWCKELTIHAAFNELLAIDMLALHELPAVRSLLAEITKQVGATKLGRVLVVALDPGAGIEEHIDEGAYADHYERFHVPLFSLKGNDFICGNEMVWMEPAQLWWFNHKQTHSAFNRSDKSRIHLIVDAVAPEYKRDRP